MKETLGQRIQRLSDERKIGVKELARLSGLSEGMIGKLKRGDRKSTTLEHGLRIARGLGVNPWELVGITLGAGAETEEPDLLRRVQKVEADLVAIRALVGASPGGTGGKEP